MLWSLATGEKNVIHDGVERIWVCVMGGGGKASSQAVCEIRGRKNEVILQEI